MKLNGVFTASDSLYRKSYIEAHPQLYYIINSMNEEVSKHAPASPNVTEEKLDLNTSKALLLDSAHMPNFVVAMFKRTVLYNRHNV